MTLGTVSQQTLFPEVCPIHAAVHRLATDSRAEDRGAVYTRREVVEFILDLVGYLPTLPLHRQRLLEPSFGGGDFLLPIVERLLTAWRSGSGTDSDVRDLKGSLRATELHNVTFEETRTKLADRLLAEGFESKAIEELLSHWLVQGDFLLGASDGQFDYIVGNPPYLRQESIPPALLAAYRARFETLFDRADLYVPFIEHSLNQLGRGGVLGFICADRWMKNRYGGPLRSLVSEGFHLKAHIDLTDSPVFHAAVTAYPAISILAREPAGPTRIAVKPQIERAALAQLAADLRAHELPPAHSGVVELTGVVCGAEPWVLEGGGKLALIRRLERDFFPLEDAGCQVGIGVATGADHAFIGPYDALDVEPDRKLPLVMTRDIVDGHVQWRGLGVINPFKDEGGLVDLDVYPMLARYLESRRSAIEARHCAQKTPQHWYRTIDRIWPRLRSQPKLLIPDIKGEAHVVYEPGNLYPHHNLYFVTSQSWELRALQAVLLSDVARLFVQTYSTKMRGGFLRFQAQYLRRIHLPKWDGVRPDLRQQLADAAIRRDFAACNDATAALFGLTLRERDALREAC